MRRLTFVIGFLLVFAAPTLAQNADPVPYPEGYRSWTHVKSMVLFPDHPLADPFEGIHHVYANEAALDGLRGGSYADGAIFVFDLLEAAQSDGVLAEGARKRIDVMHRDATRYASAGGWGYETAARSFSPCADISHQFRPSHARLAFAH